MDENQEYYLRKQYSQEFKKKVCQEYIDTKCSLRSLAIKYNFSNHSLIHEWLRRYKFIDEGIDCQTNSTFKDMKDGHKNAQVIDTDFDKYRLEKRIARLEQQLKEAEMKAEAYATMVELAEKELKISIKKKFNTKPSKS